MTDAPAPLRPSTPLAPTLADEIIVAAAAAITGLLAARGLHGHLLALLGSAATAGLTAGWGYLNSTATTLPPPIAAIVAVLRQRVA